jgi:Skp family chaperone for outer membrane proteins
MNEFDKTNSTEPLPTTESPRRRWPIVLMALVIFLAGMASGAAVTIVYAVNRLQYAIHHLEVAPARISATLARRLDLSNEQQQEIEQIIARRQTEITAIRHEFQPRIVQQLDSVYSEVAAVLDDAQRTKWSRLFEQFKERWLPAAPPDAPARTDR